MGADLNFGRELLVTLARRTGGWIGWEATTLRGLAESLAFFPLAERGVRVADDVTINAIANQALDAARDERGVGAHFASLAAGLGFRQAVRDAILELRIAGVTSDQLRAVATKGSPAHHLPVVLSAYERLLGERLLADPADVFRLALEAFDREAPFVLDGIIALAPLRTPRGLPGELMTRLLAHGAVTLDSDIGAGGTTLHADVQADFFAAASPSDELREIFRRVMAEGLRWEDIEIVATDPDAYGIALDAFSQRLGVGATMLQGIPLGRTRIGRAIDRWLDWLDDGLPADVLRQALEAGETNSPDRALQSTSLIWELRSLKIGWGRARYEAARDLLASSRRLNDLLRREDEGADEFAMRKASREQTSHELRALLDALLVATPAVPERGSDLPVRASCASLASATIQYLALFPLHGPSELQTRERVLTRLGALSAVEEEPGTFANAMAALRESLADLRAWPLVTSERKPWSAAGGMPHLATLSHAGTTGRPRVFVVGFDADRTGGSGRQDPLLPDVLRRALGEGRLMTSVERRDEKARDVARSLAGLRGRVTISYATSATLDGREASPSPFLLDAWRQASGRGDDSYEALRNALRPPASAIPARAADGQLIGVLPIDARDAWLDALADGPLLLDGTQAIRQAFPVLAAGLDAADAAASPALSAYHGMVPEAGALLDPTANPDREISPSSLETLAKCPLQWFYRYGLNLRPTVDPEYDPDAWLDNLQRGSLLHEVFEAFTREFQGRQDELEGDAASARIRDIARKIIARWRAQVPPPGETIFEAQQHELLEAASAFLHMERERFASGDRGRWLAFELGFGRGDGTGTFTLPDGRVLRTQGRADRVDEMPDGSLRVIDYKTGKSSFYLRSAKKPPFNGGRQLQPAIYLSAVEARLGKPASSFEYRFPTDRGQNETVSYSRAEVAAVPALVSGLLDHVRNGRFIPTNDKGDCGFCDHQEICRATRDDWHNTSSPRAEWAKEHGGELDEYASMIARRTVGGSE